jgi:hypothetical protein
LIFVSAGNGTWFSFLLATIGLLFVCFNINQFARRSASPGSLFTYIVKGLGPRNTHLSVSPVHYDWDNSAGEVLRITAQSVTFEVRFHARKVEIYGTAPLWARLLLTLKKKELLRQEIQSILLDAGFVSGQENRSILR